MDAKSPPKEDANQYTPKPEPSPSPAATLNPTAVPGKPAPSPAPAAAAAAPPPPEPAPADAEPLPVPSYSHWFSWTSIHECEVRFLPEFFTSKSPSKTPRVYTYYRNSIIRLYLRNPARKVTFTDARKTLAGDVGSIRRVFDFLEAWGLINYGGSGQTKALKWDDKEIGKSGGGSGGDAPEVTGGNKEGRKRICGGCKTVCTIACFACDKYDLTLCARCYVRGNYRVGVSSTDFRRVEISEDMKADWTDKETLHLLEAIMHYGDDWRRVAHHVGGRSEKECVARFVKLPFAEEFVGFPDSEKEDGESNSLKDQNDNESGIESSMSPSNKRMRLTPLADASNPIMAQAAFLSAMAGVQVTEAAAQAAVKTLSEVEYGIGGARGSVGSVGKETCSSDGNSSVDGETTLSESEKALMEANSLLEKEELDVERAVSEIVEVQLKEIHEKIVRFEELDLLMEKERQQLDEMKHMLFADRLALLSHRNSAPKTVDSSKLMEPLPLIVHHLPIAVTFAIFNDKDTPVIDPTYQEEAVMGGRLTATLNTNGDVCAIQKAGGVAVPQSVIMHCLRIATTKAGDVTSKIKEAVDAYSRERALQKIKRHSVPASNDVKLAGANVKEKQKKVSEPPEHQGDGFKQLSVGTNLHKTKDIEGKMQSISYERGGNSHRDGSSNSFIGSPSSWDPYSKGVDTDFLKLSLASRAISKPLNKLEEMQAEKQSKQSFKAKPEIVSEDIKDTSLATEPARTESQSKGERTLMDAVKPKNKRKKKASATH